MEQCEGVAQTSNLHELLIICSFRLLKDLLMYQKEVVDETARLDTMQKAEPQDVYLIKQQVRHKFRLGKSFCMSGQCSQGESDDDPRHTPPSASHG